MQPIKQDHSIEIHIQSSNWTLIDFDIHKHCSYLIKESLFTVIKKSKNIECIKISLLLTNDNKLLKLNKKFRNKNDITNVLSFPFHKLNVAGIKNLLKSKRCIFLGDIAISFERILNESIKYNKSIIEYFSYILIHGLLHLLSYDHVSDKDAKIMQSLETKIMKKIIF